MIGKLTGTLDSVSLHAVIVDVGGVGYEVTVGARTLTSLPPVGETVTLAVDTHVREDEIRLYGFASEHERAWFRAWAPRWRSPCSARSARPTSPMPWRFRIKGRSRVPPA